MIPPIEHWRFRLSAPRARTAVFAGFLVLAFLLRLAFGLASDFWGDDEHQIYLIGLKFFTTGVWPDFGPDVVYTQTQVPGGLQGLLIAGPLWLVHQPEAPYVLLNLLSFAALSLLAWYIGRRLPACPRWFLWSWLMFSPWTLDVSTHVYNPSYVLAGAIAFVVGAFEVVPSLRCGVLSRPLSFFLMGAGLLWVAQLHLSASLLVVMTALVFGLVARTDRRAAAVGIAAFMAGVALVGTTLVPTFLHHGVGVVLGRTSENVQFDPRNLWRLPQVAAQYVSFGTFEIARFLGANTHERLAFLAKYPWASPFVVVAALIGLAQAVVLLVALFWTSNVLPRWTSVRRTAAATLILVYASFAWSVRAPASHAFYVVLPVVMIYAFYVWTPLLESRPVRALAIVLLVSGAVTHVAVAMRNGRERSLYVNRAVIVRAITERNYHLVGERRAGDWN